MARYDPLRDWLSARPPGDAARVRFDDLERMVGPLPPSAREYRAWWGNHAGNSQASAWLTAGWRVDQVNLTDEFVSFRRDSGPRPPAVRPGAGRRYEVDSVRGRVESGGGRWVFLVHGRDLAARDALAELLRSFDLKVIHWERAIAETGQGSPYTGDVIDAGMTLADAVVVLLTADDLGHVDPRFRQADDAESEYRPTGQPRMNVIFEAGMALARDRSRVVLVQVGQLRPMSDIAGVNYVKLSDDVEARRNLGRRLRNVGLAVDMDHDAWRTAGSFGPRSAVAGSRATQPGRRSGSIPERLVAHRALREGQQLRIVVPAGVKEDREMIIAWLEQDPVRAVVRWHNDSGSPLEWVFAGARFSMAGLIRRLVQESTHAECRTDVWGPNWIQAEDGRTLVAIADPLP